MTPLLGTKHSSALVGAKSGGDRRAARSPLSCALWRGMGRLWRGMGGRRPPRRQHCLSCSPAVGYFFWSEPCPPTMVFTRHETRDTKHGLYARRQVTASRFTAAHYCPALLPPSCCCPPLPAICPHLPKFAHDGSLLLIKNIARASHQAPSVILGRPHDALPPPQLPPPCGLVPLRRTPNETMLRKKERYGLR